MTGGPVKHSLPSRGVKPAECALEPDFWQAFRDIGRPIMILLIMFWRRKLMHKRELIIGCNLHNGVYVLSLIAGPHLTRFFTRFKCILSLDERFTHSCHPSCERAIFSMTKPRVMGRLSGVVLTIGRIMGVTALKRMIRRGHHSVKTAGQRSLNFSRTTESGCCLMMTA